MSQERVGPVHVAAGNLNVEGVTSRVRGPIPGIGYSWNRHLAFSDPGWPGSIRILALSTEGEPKSYGSLFDLRARAKRLHHLLEAPQIMLQLVARIFSEEFDDS